MFRAHVLIIRRSKLHYTASGIITPIKIVITNLLKLYQILCKYIVVSFRLIKQTDRKMVFGL